MTTPFRIVDSVGTVMSEHATRLACAEAWNGLGHGIEAQELVFGEWSAVPVEELQGALRGARLRSAGITPQFPGLITSPAQELTRIFFDPETDPSGLPSITEWGVEYVPFTSVRISPELAAHRRALGTWSETACTAGLHVTYRTAASMGVRALGRL